MVKITKNSRKALSLLGIYLILSLTITSAYALSITFNPSTISVDESSATINWTTDINASTNVEFGNTTALGETYSDSTARSSHSARLSNLIPGIDYYYRIISSAGNETEIGDNKGEPFKFTTKADLEPPFINVSIPSITNFARMTILGTTEPFAVVRAYVNAESSDVGAGKGVRSAIAGSDGKFTLANVMLDSDENELVIWARDKAGNENRKSFSIILDTKIPNVNITIPAIPSAGRVSISGYSDELVSIDIFAQQSDEDVNPEVLFENAAPKQTVKDVSGEFSTDIVLSEGRNIVWVKASDAAGNVISKSGVVYFFSAPPTFLEPTSIEAYSPSFSDSFEIRGRLDRQATVNVYVNDNLQATVTSDSSGNFTAPVELSRDYQFYDYERTDVVGRSRAGINASTYSGTALPRRTDTRQTETPAGELAWTNHVRLEAVDLANQTSAIEGDVLLAVCGFGTWWNVQRTHVTPNVLNPGLLLNGNAQVAFDWNLSWAAGSTPGRITGVNVRFQELSDETRKNWDVDYASPSITYTSSSDGSQGYTVLSMKVHNPAPKGENWTRYEQERNISKHRFTSSSSQMIDPAHCTIFGTGCVRLPLQLEIAFDDPDYGTRIQRQCWNVEVAIDRDVINPSLIPKGFLKESVNFLNSTINVIDTVLEPLKKVQIFTIVGCAGSWLGLFVAWANEKMSCEFSSVVNPTWDVQGAEQGILKNGGSCEDDEGCSSCMDAIKDRKKTELFSQWVCDRMFCPSVPSLQKYIKDKNPAGRTVNSKSATSDCQLANPSSDKVLEYWKDFNAGTNKDKCENPHVWSEDCCIYEYVNRWDSACVLMDEARESACLADQNNVALGRTPTQGLQCYPTWNAAAGFCKAEGAETPTLINVGRFRAVASRGYEKEVQESSVNEGALCSDYFKCSSSCGKEFPSGNIDAGNTLQEQIKPCINSCKQLNPDNELCSVAELPRDTIEGQRAFIRVQPKGSPSEEGKFSKYFIQLGHAEDIYKVDSLTKTPLEPAAITPEYSFIPTEDLTPLIDDITNSVPSTKFKDYYKKNLNPSRESDIENAYNKIRDALGVSGKEIIADPTSGILRSLQCVCLPAIVSWLSWWRSALAAVKSCFEAILITGDGDSGVCQEVLSVYVCDLVYDLVSCFVKKYSSGVGGRVDGIGAFFGSISKAGDAVTNSIMSRYGSSNVFEALFADRKLVHAVCLFSFTGDWVFDVEGILQSDFPIPIASKAFIEPATRRFVSANPVSQPTGLATWNYDIGLALIAGADLNYHVELVCSNDFSCDSTEGFEGGKCDCADSPTEKTRAVNLEGADGALLDQTLRAGESLGRSGLGAVFNDNVEDDVRYDKVRVSWSYIDKEGKLVEESTESKIRQIGGTPAYCEFSATTGSYQCGVRFGGVDNAKFVGDPVPEKTSYGLGDFVDINQEIENTYPESALQSCAGSVYCQYTRFLTVTIKNQHGSEVYPGGGRERQLIPITTNGRITLNVPGSRFRIKEEDFLPKATQQLTLVGKSNGIRDVILSGTPTASNRLLFRFTSDSKYEVCDNVPPEVRIEGNNLVRYNTATGKSEEYTCKAAASGELDAQNFIRYQGFTARVIPANNAKLKGDFFLIDYQAATIVGAISQYCTSEPVEWTVTSTLYGADDESGTNQFGPSSQELDKRQTRIKVACSTFTSPREVYSLDTQSTLSFTLVQDQQRAFTYNYTPKVLTATSILPLTSTVTGAVLDANGKPSCSFTLTKTQPSTATPVYKQCANKLWVLLDRIATDEGPFPVAYMRVTKEEPNAKTTTESTSSSETTASQEELILLNNASGINKSKFVFACGKSGESGECYSNRLVYEGLLYVQDFMDNNQVFYVTSAHRTPEQQMKLYIDSGRDRSKVCGPRSGAPDNNPDSYTSCPHVTGNAIDLHLTYGGDYDTRTVSDNKISTLNLMCTAGFVNYNKEYWHYERGGDKWNSIIHIQEPGLVTLGSAQVVGNGIRNASGKIYERCQY